MKDTLRDLNKDAWTGHGPPEDTVMHPLDANAMQAADGGDTRRPPALNLSASPQGKASGPKTPGQGPEEAEGEAEAAAYRARLQALCGHDPARDIQFTNAQLADFITHAQGRGFTPADIEAILIVKLRKPWLKVSSLKDVADCLAERRGHFAFDDMAIFQDGWDFMRAYREAQAVMIKGGSLPPATYLTQDYMDMHKASFEDLASYLMTGWSYTEYIVDKKNQAPNLGYKGALYISTAAEIDRILAEAGGDIAQIEVNLGIPPGSWQGKQGLWRVDLIHPEEHLLRLPDGSEAAANEYWSPGGYTSGGTLEAVINPVPKQEGVTFTARQVIFEDNSESTNLKP